MKGSDRYRDAKMESYLGEKREVPSDGNRVMGTLGDMVCRILTWPRIPAPQVSNLVWSLPLSMGRTWDLLLAKEYSKGNNRLLS